GQPIDHFAADLRQRLRLGAGAIPDRHVMASFDETLRHRKSHPAHTDPADLLRVTRRHGQAPMRCLDVLEHDPEKWKPVFGKDHAHRNHATVASHAATMLVGITAMTLCSSKRCMMSSSIFPLPVFVAAAPWRRLGAMPYLSSSSALSGSQWRILAFSRPGSSRHWRRSRRLSHG